MKGSIGSALTLGLLAVSAFSGTAGAFPVAPLGTEGLNGVFSGTDRLIATYEGNSAYYSNDLFLMLDPLGNVGDDGDLTNDLFIFNNHSSGVGSTFDIDGLTPGTELLFRLFVHNTETNYYSGPGSRNPDGKAHAMVQNNWMPGFVLVSFEDLYGTPESPGGYNDLSFSFRNRLAGEVPEPHAASLLLCGVLAMIAFRGRKVP